MKETAFCLVCCLMTISLVEGVDNSTKAPGHGASTVSITAPKLASTKPQNFTLNSLPLTGSMIQRALYVLIGITILGVLYFLVRAVRLKKSSTPRKKYGLLANYDDTVEMAQLESDEDDNTVYEAKSLRR
ncbi:protein FAM174C [Clarias gariepinus]|uniref:protein FAM174C n=1 Tax=Clarias gariepinus TaxID=13013 RepID=UPI00234DC30A|nr:protein FAM174C [Clarias gariepinus]